MLKFLESRYTFLLSCIFFRAFLDISYIIFVSPVFSYSGFDLETNLYGFFISWAFYVLCVVLTPHVLYRLSDYFIASFLLAILAPLSSLIGLNDFSLYPFFVTVAVFVFFCLFRHGQPLSFVMPVPKLPGFKSGRIVSICISICAVLFLLFWYFYSGGIKYLNFDFHKVYEFREASADVVSVGFLAYFNNWVYSVFSIFLMSVFLLRGKYFIFVWVLLVQVVFYGVSAHKSVLFFPFMILGIWFYFRKAKGLSVMPMGFSFVILFCLLLYFSFDHVMAGSMFIRRVFYVPAYLTLNYFDFFSVNERLYWSNSVLSGFNSYPYELPLGALIGEYNGLGGSANNGFISSGYAHAGLLGVFIYSFVFAYFLKVLDVLVLKSDVPVWLGLCMTIVPLRSALISSDLLTAMLTHGLLVSLCMLLLFRRKLDFKSKNYEGRYLQK